MSLYMTVGGGAYWADGSAAPTLSAPMGHHVSLVLPLFTNFNDWPPNFVTASATDV
jgi:hypothetical protein